MTTKLQIKTSGSLTLPPGRLRSSGASHTQKVMLRGKALGSPSLIGGGSSLSSKRQSRSAHRRLTVRVEALFETFTENSITSILLAQGFARDMHSSEVR